MLVVANSCRRHATNREATPAAQTTSLFAMILEEPADLARIGGLWPSMAPLMLEKWLWHGGCKCMRVPVTICHLRWWWIHGAENYLIAQSRLGSQWCEPRHGQPDQRIEGS